jgi:predicted GIY-YIG superfamily endonuclease
VTGDRARRDAMWVLATGVAAIAAIVSYSHIFALGREHGGSGTAARLLPLSVDMLIVVGELMLLHEADSRGRRYALGWLLVWSGILATLAANVTYGAQYGPVGALIWGWPAYSFILVAAGMVSIVKRRGVAAPVKDYSGRTALYRLFDADGALLYIGITISPQDRMKEHSWRKPWWPEVQRSTVEWHDTWHAAAEAEQAAISAEEPNTTSAASWPPSRLTAGRFRRRHLMRPALLTSPQSTRLIRCPPGPALSGSEYPDGARTRSGPKWPGRCPAPSRPAGLPGRRRPGCVPGRTGAARDRGLAARP